MKIIGPIQPNIGEKVQYTLSGNGITSISNNGSAVPIFELYEKRRNGNFVTTNVVNNTGTFLFGEIAAENELKVVVLNPDSNEKLAELNIMPQKGSEGQIHDVGLQFMNNNSSTQFSKLDKVEAVAYTTNLIKRSIIFELYNADEDSNDESQKPLATKEAVVGSNGTAVAQFNLAQILLNVPSSADSDEDLNNFYVTAKRKPPTKEVDNSLESSNISNG